MCSAGSVTRDPFYRRNGHRPARPAPDFFPFSPTSKTPQPPCPHANGSIFSLSRCVRKPRPRRAGCGRCVPVLAALHLRCMHRGGCTQGQNGNCALVRAGRGRNVRMSFFREKNIGLSSTFRLVALIFFLVSFNPVLPVRVKWASMEHVEFGPD
jgi:hypothetical protein